MDEDSRSMELETVVFGNSNPPKSSMQMPEEMLSVGDILCGIYILRMRLGRGGMGEIWKADEVYEGEILRTVVIKTLAPNVQNVEEEFARIQSMFHKIHSLQHQHICPMYAMKNDPKAGTIIVMKFIDGMMLQEYYTQYIRLHEDFPVSEVVRLLLPIAQALDYSHSKKVLHRDVKPQNILVSKDESDGVQLIDFGLVMEMRSSLADNTSTHFDGSGTLPYMSPEQWSGDFQDAKTDQFSLAVVVYELLAGKLPFSGNNIQILGFQILNKSPDPIPNVPDSVNFALQKALAKDRKQRFETCVEFINALTTPFSSDVMSAETKRRAPLAETAKKGTVAEEKTFSKKSVYMVAGGSAAAVLVLALGASMLRPSGKTVADVQGTPSEMAQNTPQTGEGAIFKETLPRELSASMNSTRVDERQLPEPIIPPKKQASEPEVKPEPVAEPEVKPEPVAEPEVKPEPVAEPEVKPEPVAEPEVKPEPVVEPEVKPEPVAEPEVKSESVAEPEEPETVSAEELLVSANTALEQNDFESAFTAFHQLPLETLDYENLEKYAVCCENLGRFYSAMSVREQQLKQEETPEQLLAGVRDALEADTPKLALSWVEILLKATPDSAELLQLKATTLNQLATKLHDTGVARKSVEIYNQLLEKMPENAELYACRGFVYLKNPASFPKAYDLAKADIERAIEMNPECLTARLYHGMLLRDVYRQKISAVRELETILEKEPQNADTLLQLGITVADDKPELAQEYFTRYITLRPEKVKVYEDRGKLFLTQKKYTEALEDFNHCLEQDEMNFMVRKLRADAETHLERWRDAKADYDFLLANDEQPANQVEYYLGLAKVYDGAKQRRRAEEARDAAERIRRAEGL